MSRRARNPDGSIIAPLTVAGMISSLGIRHVEAYCTRIGCGHSGRLSVEAWPGEVPIPDIGLRLRCSRCDARRTAHTRPDWTHWCAFGRR